MTKRLADIVDGEHEKVSDKWSSYLRTYERYLAQRQLDPIRLLEIGVQNGGSLEVWSKYFPNAEVIIGCDINPACGDLTYKDPRVRVFVGDACCEAVKARILKSSSQFDVIIDDGSHKSDDIIKGFARYFPLLEHGGIYIAEDLHSSYFEDYQGGTEAPYSSLSFFKRLTDYVNREHWGAEVASDSLLNFFSTHLQTNFDPTSLDDIAEIAFYNSMVIVQKGHPGDNALGHRVITGTSALVDDRVLNLHKTEPLKRNESRNPFGPLGMRLEAYPNEAARLKDSLEATNKELLEAQDGLISAHEELRLTQEELRETSEELRRWAEENALTTEALQSKTGELQRVTTQLRLKNEEFDAAVRNSDHLIALKSKELEAKNAHIDLIAAELTNARRKPFKQLGKLIPYKVLSRLSKSRPFVSKKAAKRFAKSAAKRHPARLPPQPKISAQPVASVPVAKSQIDNRDENNLPDNLGSISELADASTLSGKLLPIAESGFWDERWYKERHWKEIISAAKQDNRIISPLHHYVIEGWKNGYKPSPQFPLRNRKGSEKDPITDFLERVQYDGYQFEENVWFPSARDIKSYLENVESRKAKCVIYTCIVGNYDDLMQPKHIHSSSDYVCFTDREEYLELQKIGVWTIRSLACQHDNPTLANRWHKMHPHKLFPEYEESLYLDGNVNVLSPYIFETIAERKAEILVPKHFKRTCMSEELDVLASTGRIYERHARQLENLIRSARSEGLPVGWGLSENNVIFRKHHSPKITTLMQQWWELTETLAPRDQAHFSYLLWQNGFSFPSITFPNCRSLYKDFAVIRHNTKEEAQLSRVISKRMSPAFSEPGVTIALSCNEVFVDFLDVMLTSIVENRSSDRNYDIIILNRDLSDASKQRISDNHGVLENVAIRFYDMTSILDTFSDMDLHLEGYVPIETYNKIFLNDILEGFDKVAYIDTDIILDEDIANLYDIDLCGRAIGASLNVANIHAANAGKTIKDRNFFDYLRRDLGVLNVNKYFQAGILILDLKHRNTQKLFRKCVEKINEVKEPVFFDQCIFNSVFYGDVLHFSTKWNTVWYLQNYSYIRSTVPEEVFFDYARAHNRPSIVHFASGDKPTKKTDWRLGDYFWKYASRSNSREVLLAALSDEQRHSPQVVGSVTGQSFALKMTRTLVHVHLYYENQLPFMLDSISNLGDAPRDVYFTIQNGSKIDKAAVSAVEPSCKFLEVPNLGYDLFPFVEVLRRVNLSKYDYVLKLHTKAPRSKEQGNVYGVEVLGDAWRNALVGDLVGSPEIARANLERLNGDRTIGALGSEDFIFSTHENNEEKNYNLAHWRAFLGVNSGSSYVGGTMFLARAFPFERFKKLHNRPDMFSGAVMRTKSHKNFAHVAERLCGIVIENEGLTIQGVKHLTN